MRAAVLTETSGTLDVCEVAIDKPGPMEVLIRTVAAGLCHTDLGIIEMPAAAAMMFGLPMVLGHEGAGVVEAVGEGVTYVSPGDHVMTYGTQYCGECEFCHRGRQTICPQALVWGKRPDGAQPRLTLDGTPVAQFVNVGSFAEQMLVHEHGIIKIDPEYPLDKAAVLSCGGATGLGSVLNAAAVRPGSTVAVVGCGGVGLSAIQGAVIAGARRIIAVDTQPAKLELAKSLGATDCVDASAGDAVAQVVELTGGGVDYSFATAAVSAVSEQCLQMLRSGGLATVIGSGADNIQLSLGFLVIGERRIQGALMGSNLIRTDIPRYVEFDQQGRIDVAAMVDSHITLAEVNEGFAAMQEAAINGRKVIMFE